jgi:tetratricopeptide (TPR) repeat protein
MRHRRINPVRLWIFLAFVIVLATIPLSLLGNFSGINISMPEFFKAAEPKKAAATQSAAAVPATNRVQAAGSDSAAAYVQALDKAAQKISAEINKSPSDPALQNRLGLIYLTLGDSKSAEQCFSNAVSLSRSKISGYASDVERLKRSGKMKDASSTVIDASKASVELSAAHSNLARIYDQRGDRAAVMAELDQINKDGLLFSGFAAADGKLKSKDEIMSTQDAQELAQAEAFFKANQIAPALAAYKKLIVSNPKMPFLYDRIGLLSVMSGNVHAAVSSWEKAAELNPSSAAIRSNLGLAYHQLGMNEESEQAFRSALKLDPKMEEAALNLSEMLTARGRVPDAINLLKESNKHCPHSARVANNLGSLYLMTGKFDDAAAAFHQATRNDPSMASAHYGMGVALMKKHQYTGAVIELRLALLANPKLVDAQNKIAECQKLSGNRN